MKLGDLPVLPCKHIDSKENRYAMASGSVKITHSDSDENYRSRNPAAESHCRITDYTVT